MQVCCCSDCGKYYQTDMTDYVTVNSNITSNVINIILDLYRDFSGSYEISRNS